MISAPSPRAGGSGGGGGGAPRGLPGCLRTVWPEKLGEAESKAGGSWGRQSGQNPIPSGGCRLTKPCCQAPGKSRMALQAAAKGRNISISRISSKEISSHSHSCIWGNHFGGDCGLRREGGRAPRRGMETSVSLQELRAPMRTRYQIPRDSWGAGWVLRQTFWTTYFHPNGQNPLLRSPLGRLQACPLSPLL